MFNLSYPNSQNPNYTEMFENNNEDDEDDTQAYNLTQDSTAIDKLFEQFKDTLQYLQKPTSSTCFTGTNKQYSRRVLAPKNHIMPHVYFPSSNKTHSRIINVDEFKTHILDIIRNKHGSDVNGDDKNDIFEEVPDPKFSHYDNPNYAIVDTDVFDTIIDTLKTYLDDALHTYVQTGSTQIKCKSDMSDCPTYSWEPAIVRIRINSQFYEYTFQMTYYIQNKAYAYVIICKCYVSRNTDVGGLKLLIDELDLLGLNPEQNIMLTSGYTKSQMDSHVNIFSDYPYTPYEANLTYYRSSDEDTYIRHLYNSDDFTFNNTLIDDMVEEHRKLQTDVTKGSVCISTETGELLKYDTKEECEATINNEGNPKDSGTFDNQCTADSDCPFYLANTNYPNEHGGCGDDGFCELPVNTDGLSYKSYNDKGEYYPYCYGCGTDKMNTCCNIQQKMIDGTATDEEISEHGLTGKTFTSLDYAFKGDFADRIGYQDDLNVHGLEVN
jgi:hypothetical protein